MAYNVGGMLASAGQNIGQSIGGGISGVGTGIAGMLTRRGEKRAEQEAQQQFQQILAANQNNPDVLRTKGQEMMVSRDPNMQRIGKMLMDEAVRLTALQTTKEEKGTAQGIQGGLSAITQAAARGIPLSSDKEPDLREAVGSIINLGGTQEQIMSAYKAGSDMAKGAKPETLQGTPGTQFLRRDPETGKLVVEATVPFKPEPQEVESLSVSALKDIATPESIIEYINTGDENVLVPLTEEEPDEKATRSKLLATDNVLQTVKEASGLTEEVYPLFYDFSQFFPTTDARQLSNRVDTLKSTLSFDRLQQMRDESKTGGALGNVSNVELGLLGSNLAALDPASGDFAQQLKKVETHYTNFKRALLGQKPLGDRYVEDEGILYYKDDEGDYVSLGKL